MGCGHADILGVGVWPCQDIVGVEVVMGVAMPIW